MGKKVCIIITGPTAVGKTSLAIQIAQHFSTAVISADSRQCFKELEIGVAKPSAAQLQLVKHYFINSHSVTEEVNAALFEQYALDAVNEIFQQHEVAVMVGGTGLYIKAFCEGLDEIPPIPVTIRNLVNEQYASRGLAWLQDEVKEKDPEYYTTGEIQNPQRLVRALEVKLSTGKSIRTFQQGKKDQRGFTIIKIGLNLPREQLYNNINQRVDDMMRLGLLDEVKSLLPYRNRNALQTVGYTELFDHLDEKITRQEAIESIKKNTRHYAKRQLTWFNRDQSIQWFLPVDFNQVISSFQNLV
jgi:tRNA dimethylallyltransferase